MNDSAAKWQHEHVQGEELIEDVGQFFLRPVASRWLSVEPVCRQIIDQYAALLKYFLKELPKHEKTMIPSTKSRYVRVRVLRVAFESYKL